MMGGRQQLGHWMYVMEPCVCARTASVFAPPASPCAAAHNRQQVGEGSARSSNDGDYGKGEASKLEASKLTQSSTRNPRMSTRKRIRDGGGRWKPSRDKNAGKSASAISTFHAFTLRLELYNQVRNQVFMIR